MVKKQRGRPSKKWTKAKLKREAVKTAREARKSSREWRERERSLVYSFGLDAADLAADELYCEARLGKIAAWSVEMRITLLRLGSWLNVRRGDAGKLVCVVGKGRHAQHFVVSKRGDVTTGN